MKAPFVAHRRLLASLFLLPLALGGAAATQAQQAPAEAPPPAERPIEENEVRAHILKLASDAFEGRAPGTMGEVKTLDYLARQWHAMGLVSGTNDPANRWFQPVPLVERIPFSQSVEVMKAGRRYKTDASGLFIAGRGASETVDAPLVFVGYGVDGEARVVADVAGKIAVMLYNGPDIEGDDRFTRRARINALAQAGASAVLEILPDSLPFDRVINFARRGGTILASEDNGPAIGGMMTEDYAARLLQTAGLDVDSAVMAAREDDFRQIDLPLTMRLSTTGMERPYTSHNVVAKLPGNKPGSGAVLLLGHWDHFGTCRPEGEEDRICNGAVDNASGMAVLLTVADRLAKGPRLDRDVYFLGTTAEERGLLGAKWFAENPSVPLEDIVIALNVDTVAIAGAGAPVAIIGRGEPLIDPLIGDIETVAREAGREVEPSDDSNAFIRRQDGWALLAKGVPAIMAGGSFADLKLLETFLSGDYHGPGDELRADTPLAGATEDANLHVALVRYFADAEKYRKSGTSE